MGFFSDILGTVAGVAGSFLGVRAPVAAPMAAPVALAPLAAISAPPGALVPTVVAGTRGQMISPGTREALFKAAGSPTGGLRKRTTVETFDPGSGFVTKVLIFDGGVAVRSADIAAFKRVFRQITRISKKLPRKVIKQSQVKALTDRLVKNALEQAGDLDAPCPK